MKVIPERHCAIKFDIYVFITRNVPLEVLMKFSCYSKDLKFQMYDALPSDWIKH